MIPVNGATIYVWIDGEIAGNPVYNNPRPDIAALFPDYLNSNGASGYFYMDTRGYENGLHTIQWSVTDNAGNSDGIGSRYFNILNASGLLKSRRASASNSFGFAQNKRFTPVPSGSIGVRTGFSPGSPLSVIQRDRTGEFSIKVRELDRIEIHFPIDTLPLNSPLIRGKKDIEAVSILPVGSRLDKERGIFYWSLGPGFVGNYTFEFVVPGETKPIRVNIKVGSLP